MTFDTKARQRAKTSIVKSAAVQNYPGGRPVLPPVVRASTVLFDSVEQMEIARSKRDVSKVFTYGAKGNPTAFCLEDAISELDGGYRTRLFPTGLAAIAMVFTAYLSPGDHILIADCVYQPVRRLVKNFCQKFGIRATYFEPSGSDLDDKIEKGTRAIYAEYPGSILYELCDMVELASFAKRHALLLIADNTWGSGLQYSPLRLGADVSIIAATKYLGGHADVMMGAVTTTEEAWAPLFTMCDTFGMAVSADDAYLVLRGMRSLSARLAAHEHGALQVARWLCTQSDVAHVFCPALPAHPQHSLWLRDCSGTNGLVSFEFRNVDEEGSRRFLNALRVFGIGASWGGFESLATPCYMQDERTLSEWSGRGPVIRLHIGLEDPDDLIEDLRIGFASCQGVRTAR